MSSPSEASVAAPAPPHAHRTLPLDGLSASPTGAIPAGRPVSLEEKIRFLSDPRHYPEPSTKVESIETHMSWIFLVGAKAYKLKKPVKYPFLDFSTLQARQADCELELSLNRRLAPETYLGLAAIRRDSLGRLSFQGDDPPVDWLVVMQRLPKDEMLDVKLARDGLDSRALARLAYVLARFYASAQRPEVNPEDYAARLAEEQSVNRSVIASHRFDLGRLDVPRILDRMDRLLAIGRPLLLRRAQTRQLVDGHGDLRPEHICFQDGVIIFDCLEFSRELRILDPIDELAYFSLECALLGEARLGDRVARRVFRRLHERLPPALFYLHQSRRAVLRARLTLAHLLEPRPRTPEKWEPLGRKYLYLAAQSLNKANAFFGLDN